WESIVPYFLMRGQALDSFSGREWHSVPGKRKLEPAKEPGEGSVEILRQPLPTDVLPVPYGAMNVRGKTDFSISPYATGEWFALGARTRSLRYEVEFGKFRVGALGDGRDPLDVSFNSKIFPE